MIWLLCSVVLWASVAQAQSTSYVYDANGRVVAVSSSTASVQYSYDTLGHTSQISAPLSPSQMAIFAFTPTHGEAGTQVTIQGQGFDSNVANDTVSFNGTVATVLSASATQLVTTVPSGATTGPISVTADGQSATSATPFVVDDTGLPPTITQVSPLLASVGTSITVTGTHLDPMSGDTTVQMGGVDIPALSAISDTQLQYAVPNDGMSGYVTVNTPYGLATSPAPVVVLAGGVSASSVASSGNATVNGNGVNLNIGTAGQYGVVTFTGSRGAWISLQASAITTTASSINYAVYAPGSVLIQTGAISASSPSIHLPQLIASGIYQVFVQPTGGSAQMTLNVANDGQLAINTATTVVTNVPGQSARLLFNAAAGQNLAFEINGTSTNPSGQTVSYTIYTPSGTSYTTTSTSTTGFVNLGFLPAAGTYQVVVAPGSGVMGTMQIEVAQGVGGALNGTSQNYAAAVSGQNVYMSFTATQGENLELTFNNVNVTGGSSDQFYVYVYNSAGTQIASFGCSGTSPGASCMQPLWYLSAGTYTAVAVPNYGGKISFNALLQDDLVGPNLPVGGTTNIALGAGQVERLTFNANVGETVALNVSGVTTTPTGQSITFYVYSPSVGTAIIANTTPVYTTFSVSGSQVANLSNLPMSGTYTVIAVPNYGLPATAQFSVLAGAGGTLTSGGSSQSYAGSASGQNIYFSFNATQNENLELTFNNVSVTGGSSNQFYVYVYNALGTQVDGFPCSGTSPGASCMQHLWYLSAGTYTVVATPNYGGTISMNALLEDDLIGPTVATGSTANIALSAGQVERYTFNANAGDTVALNVSGLTTTPTGQAITFYVYSPSVGTAITTNTTAYTTFSASGQQVANLSNLPVSGTYTVIAAPNYGLPATAQLSVLAGAGGTLTSGGAPQSYAGSATGQNVYLTFTATQNENLELTLNNVSAPGSSNGQFTVYVFNAAGAQITDFICYQNAQDASCSGHLWYLSAGTYTVMVTPNWGGTASFNALLQDDIVGPTLTTGSTANIALGAGQVERFTFNANAGDTVALNVSGATTTPSGQTIMFYVFSPSAGSTMQESSNDQTAVYTSFSVSGQQAVNLSNLPMSGTYTIVAAPNYGLAATAQLSLLAGAGGNLTAGSAPQGYSGTVAGQNVYMTFTATQNENLELTLNNVSAPGSSNNQFTAYVFNAAGSQITAFVCYQDAQDASCSGHLWYLPAGTYTVMVTPNWGGTPSFDALLQDDIVGSTVTPGNAANIALGAGQVERLTFNANAGDTVALNVSGVTTTPSGQAMTFNIYSPSVGPQILDNSGVQTPTYTWFTTSGSQAINLSNLPASGTYTVIAMPNYGLSATAQFSVESDTAGSPNYGNATLAINGAAQSETASQAGANVTMTFNADTGDNVELMLNNINVPGASTNGFRYDVYNSAGTDISGSYCYASSPGGGCRVSLWNLVAGTYTVVVSPYWGGTISVTAQLFADVSDGALTLNTPASIDLAEGQVQRLTFTANAGDTVALNLSGVTSTLPTGQPIYVNVYRPDAGLITTGNYYTYFDATSSGTLNLQNLPEGGTYTVVVYTFYGTPATGQLTLVPGATGSLVENGTSQSVAAGAANQNVYFTFNANQGDNTEVTLSGINVPGATTNGIRYDIYNAEGTDINGNYCYASTPGAGCRISLWNLAAGTYTVVVSPYWGGTINVTGQAQTDVSEGALVLNTPVSINLTQGQVQRLTFNASVGETVALNLSGVSSTSPTGQAMYVNVYRPDTGTITTGNYYTYFDTTSSSTLNLQSLPVGGTYTVVVYTPYGTPAAAQLTLVPGASGGLTENGALQSVSATDAGQNVYYTFNANQGDNLELTLNNINVPGATTNGVRYDVYNAAGTDVNGSYCYAASPGAGCRVALWNMAAGTYTVVVSPYWGGTINVTAQVQTDVSEGTLTPGAPISINLAQGQVQRFTFNANTGDSVALNLSGVSSTSPTGQPVYVNVYRPDTGSITTGNYYTYFDPTSSGTLNLQNLPAGGTYTVVVYTPYGTPATAQLTLASGETGGLTENGAAQGTAATEAGQNVYYTFSANQGDNLELTLNNLNVPGATTNGVRYDVYNAAGTDINGNYCYAGSSGAGCRIALWNMVAGNYTVVVSPYWGGTINVSAQLQTDVSEGALALNTPATINLALGQVERFTFNAAAGQSMTLNLSGVSSTSPTGQQMYVSVYRPDVGSITTANAYQEFSASSSNTLSLQNLPATGTYTAVVYTNYGTPAAGQLTLSAGSSQSVYTSFTANAGANLELTLNNVNALGASTDGFEAIVKDPTGSQIANFYCYASSPGSSCTQPIWNALAGTYSLTAIPVFGGSVSYGAQVQPDLVGPALTAGTATTVTLGQGQTERVTFNANQGNNVVLQLAGVSTTPANQDVYVYVYRPDVGEIEPTNAYASFEATGANSITLSNLPVGGTYTAVVRTATGIPASAQLSFTTQ
jgi:large repetitive protein